MWRIFCFYALRLALARLWHQIPRVPEAFLAEGGALRAIFAAIRLLGRTVVPLSCLLVGARVYLSQKEVCRKYMLCPQGEDQQEC